METTPPRGYPFVLAVLLSCVAMLNIVNSAIILQLAPEVNVTSHVSSSQTHAPVIEQRDHQSPANTQAAYGEDSTSFFVNRDFIPGNITEITDKYLFDLSIHRFEAKRKSRQPPTLNWSSDGCTKAPDDIGTWDFLPACHRHDFGLRNYREQGRLDKTTKRRIDDQFLEE